MTIPMGTSVPMPICQRPLCIMPRCGIWCLCDWHSLGRDPVGRLDAAATGTGAAMLVQAGRADRGEACNLNGHKFNKASADADRRGCLRRWPRRSGAGQQSSPSRPTTASAASAAACLQPQADWHQGHVRSTLEMHHVCMAGRTIPKPPMTPVAPVLFQLPALLPFCPCCRSRVLPQTRFLP